MRKKFLSVVLTAMCLAFAACGGNGEPTEESKQTGMSQKEEKKESTQDKEEITPVVTDEIKELYSKVAFPAWDNVYFNYNKERTKFGGYYGSYFTSDRTTFAIFQYSVPGETDEGYVFSGSLEELFDLFNDGRTFRSANKSAIRGVSDLADEITIELDSSENVKINDLETFHFKGHASYTKYEDAKYYLTGYTFVISDLPCMMVGVIFGDEGDEEAHASLDEEIYIMMTTVRTER